MSYETICIMNREQPNLSLSPALTINVPTDISARAWCQISASAFAHNITVIKQALGQNALAMVIKSNAYGHGLELMATLANSNPSIAMLCTTSLAEAEQLITYGVNKPILALYDPFFSLSSLQHSNVRLGVYSYAMLDKVAHAARLLGKKIPIHLKIDTGMTRYGISPESIHHFLAHAAKLPIILEGLFTHLADKSTDDDTISRKQLELFEKVVRTFKSHGYEIPFVHALSSGALHMGADYPFLTMARVGSHCYGLVYDELDNKRMYHQNPSWRLKPLLAWKAKLAGIKKVPAGAAISYNRTYIAQAPMTIGMLPIGYADGLPRSLSNKSFVIINHKKAPLVGLISMNLASIDLTHIPEASLNDEVLVMGPHTGITAHDRAQQCSTLPIDITTAINPALLRTLAD